MAVIYRPARATSFRTYTDMATVEIKSSSIKKINGKKIEIQISCVVKRMLFFHKKCLLNIDGGDEGSLLYMCPCMTMEYPTQWCQDSLDFVFRMISSGLMEIDYPDAPPTTEERKDIFDQMASLSPNIPEGGAIWSTYQFYMLDAGLAFWDEWKNSGDNALYWQKLNYIFDEHGVGFDKSAFVPIQFK